MTKTLKISTIISFVSILAVVGALTALAHQISTSATVSFSVNPATDGDIVDITGTITQSGSEHPGVGVGNPVTSGTIQIQELMLGGVGVPVGTPGAVWTTIGSGSPDINGQFSVSFDTTGLGGNTIGFRAHYPASGGGHGFAQVSSPGEDLVINSSCEGVVTIASDLASGNGTPPPGFTGDWEFRIKVKACKDVTNVSAQGGTSGWTSFVSATSSTGSAEVRKQNKKTSVLLWTIGDMSAGDEATLLVKVSGTVKPGTPDGTELFLSGAWSAKYTDSDNNVQKSDYTGRVSVTVTNP